MNTIEIIKRLKFCCPPANVIEAAIKKILEVESKPTPGKKDYTVTMNNADYKEFLRFKLFNEFIKTEL